MNKTSVLVSLQLSSAPALPQKLTDLQSLSLSLSLSRPHLTYDEVRALHHG